MSLDVSTVGFKTEPFTFKYDWKTVALYALGIGAKREELDFLYEGRGPKVFPTFAVIPAFAPVQTLFEKTRCDMTRLLHGGQTIRLHRPIPAEGTLQTVGHIKGIYDMKKLAQVVLETTTTVNGEPCFDTEWLLWIRDAGGFAGPRPPKSEVPKIPAGKSPDWIEEDVTQPEQALLYRLSGDVNPLHADPEFAKVAGFAEGPILHGLCTYGFLGRAVLKHACGNNPARLKSLTAQFRKPVWPSDKLRTEGYHLDDGRVVVETYAGDRPEPVIVSAFAEVRSE